MKTIHFMNTIGSLVSVIVFHVLTVATLYNILLMYVSTLSDIYISVVVYEIHTYRYFINLFMTFKYILC